MTTLKIKDKEYKLKFGFASFKKSGVLREVLSMQKKIKSNSGNESENTDDNVEENIDVLEEVLELSSKLVLVALQKNHEEFRVDYTDHDAVVAAIDKVDSILDDYMDEEDSMPIMDLFHELTKELFEGGFLSKKTPKLEEALEKQDATIVPIDHRQTEN